MLKKKVSKRSLSERSAIQTQTNEFYGGSKKLCQQFDYNYNSFNTNINTPKRVQELTPKLTSANHRPPISPNLRRQSLAAGFGNHKNSSIAIIKTNTPKTNTPKTNTPKTNTPVLEHYKYYSPQPHTQLSTFKPEKNSQFLLNELSLNQMSDNLGLRKKKIISELTSRNRRKSVDSSLLYFADSYKMQNITSEMDSLQPAYMSTPYGSFIDQIDVNSTSNK